MSEIVAAMSFTSRVVLKERHYVINAADFLSRTGGNHVAACMLAFDELKLPELLHIYQPPEFDRDQITEITRRYARNYFELTDKAASSISKLEGHAILGEDAYEISSAAHRHWHGKLGELYEEITTADGMALGHDTAVQLAGSLIARVLNVGARICNFAMLTPNDMLDNKRDSNAQIR